LRVVDVSAESVLHGLKISLVAVRGDLYAVANPRRAIFHELLRPVRAERFTFLDEGYALGVACL
jgi:hypothetical protein